MNLTAEQNEFKCTYCATLVRRPEAEAQFIEIKNSKVGGALLIAQTAQEGGDYAEALIYFNKVIEQQQDFPDAWLSRGICQVRTSTIGNLKIPEAISSWKAAIKFAKHSDAMSRRVAQEIAETVNDFYPALDSHYEKFKETKGTLSEHYERFLTLVTALTLAQEMDPKSELVARTGFNLCKSMSKTMEKIYSHVPFGRFAAKKYTENLNSLAEGFRKVLQQANPQGWQSWNEDNAKKRAPGIVRVLSFLMDPLRIGIGAAIESFLQKKIK